VSSFSIKFDPSDITGALDHLAKGAADVRPAAQAGAQVLYEEVLVRVPVRSGGLKDSIYQVYSQDQSSDGRATYHVSWNARKAPHGHLIEFGTSRAPAHPFLRPAYDAKVKEALEAARRRWLESSRKAVSEMRT
jgi:HK97 gp10 family phage protein